MSGFVKRNRAVNTANPAGGINPALEPNVGQYGWTKGDSAHVNQLIGYVNAAKEYAEQAKQSADFITGNMSTVTDLYNKVIIMYDKVVPLATRIEYIYRNILTLQDDVDRKYEEILLWHSEISTWVVEVQAMHREAGEFSANAIKAASDAAESAQHASDIAEELRKGMVYRGTWNVEATSAYPPHGGTNSTWDVILNPGSLEFTWSGTTWYWGDRLIYLKDDAKYQQVESGTTVVSVNGKKGAVILNSADVGAVSKTGDTMTGNLTMGVGKISINNASNSDAQFEAIQGTAKGIFRTSSGDAILGAMVNDAWGGYLKVGPASGFTYAGKDGVVRKVYHEGLKPTAADVGALPLSGGNLTGPLTLTNDQNLNLDSSPDGYCGDIVWRDKGAQKARVWSIGSDRLALSPSSETSTSGSGVLVIHGNNDITIGGNKVYTEHAKPTAADTGAVNKAGDTMTGSLIIPEVKIGSNNGIITSVGQTGRNLRIGGSENVFLNSGSKHGAFLGNNFTYTDGWSKIDNDQPSGALCVQGEVITFFSSPAGNTNPIVKQGRVYHEGFKPTAADVGALPATNGSVIVDTTFGSGGPAPLTISRNGQVGMQIKIGSESRYLGVSSGDFKLRYGLNLDHQQNWAIYHSGNPPTAREVEYTNPRTKNVETLMDVIAELTSRIEALEKQIKENT